MRKPLIAEYPLGGHATSLPSGAVHVHRLPHYRDATVGKSDVEHRHAFHQVLFFLDAGSHSIDFGLHQHGPSVLGFIPAGAVHRFDGVVGRGFVANIAPEACDPGAALETALVALGGTPFGTVQPDLADDVGALFRLLEHYIGRESSVNAMIRGLVATLLAATLDAVAMGSSKPRSSIVARYIEQVELSFPSGVTTAAIAQRVGVSPRVLHREIKHGLGRSPQQVLNVRRMLEAKRLLAHSENSVFEIASAIGLDDVAYFARFFRRCEGCAPTEFRKRLRPS